MTFLSDPFDRWLFLGAFAAVTVITGWALISLCHDLRRRKVYTESPTLPVVHTLPTVRPAYHFDHSDTTEATLAYCPACALESVAAQGFRDGDGFYPMPRGVPSFCLDHWATWTIHAAQENNA